MAVIAASGGTGMSTAIVRMMLKVWLISGVTCSGRQMELASGEAPHRPRNVL